MKNPRKFDSTVNKFANTLRLFGIFLLLISTVGLVSYRSETDTYWDGNNLFLVAILVSAVQMVIVGELLWRIVLKYSDETTHRQFYFYDEE
jgi:membrane protein YdbS with pleckstrin-like domain